MTPQSSFMVLAPLQRSRIGPMRELLGAMNFEPGRVNPQNAIVPFERLGTLHFARFLVLDDPTTGDLQVLYGIRRPELPIYLAFLGDFDGSYDAFVDDLVREAGAGLRRIFELCDGFSPDTDLRSWITSHEQRPATWYCNWIGRTVQQTKEEERLRCALRSYLQGSPELADSTPAAIHQALRAFVDRERAAGRLKLTPPAPTPFSWTVRQISAWAGLVLLIVAGVVTLPLTIIPLLIIAWRLRALEKSDPVMAPRPAREQVDELARLEDHEVTNQFNAVGALKPGFLRSLILSVILSIVNLTTHTIYTRGRLARVHTIHFARWVYLDNGARLIFASNYDGSLESYMDDFINKVAFGLNAVFGNGAGYPRTEWLLLKGAKDEQTFKYLLRRHQLPSDVWYNAHSGLTAFELDRNSRIRDGLESASLSAGQAGEWVALL